MIILWGVAVIFAALSIIFLCGKGGVLISGYNTSSTQNKKKYNEKKLCRTMGIGMSVMTILLIIMAIFGENISGTVLMICLVIMGLDIVIMMFWTNTKCYATDENGNRIAAPQDVKKDSKMSMVVSVILAVVFLVIGVVLLTGRINVEFNSTGIQVQATYWKDYEVEYADINSVTFSENNVPGSRVGGFGSFTMALGRFEDQETYGRYTRYTYVSCDACIILDTESDGIIVLNGKNVEQTQQIYDEISKNVDNRGYEVQQ